MSDLDLLRAALRERASLAPDSDAVFAKVTDGIRRRRARRRAAGLVGTAAATVGVLVAAGWLNTAASPAGSVPVAASPGSSTSPAPVPGPRLPFSVTAPPDGYHLSTWRIGPAESSVQYVGHADFQTIVVRLRPQDPAAGASGQATTVQGIPAMRRPLSPGGSDTELSWQLSPGQWASVYGAQPAVSEQQLRSVAESVTATPVDLATSLRVASLPNGLAPTRWSGDSISNNVTLCPPGADSASAANRCVEMGLRAGTAPDTWTVRSAADKVSGASPATTPLSQPGPDGTRLSPDGHVVVRQLDPTHWLSVNSAEVDSAVLRELATAASVG